MSGFEFYEVLTYYNEDNDLRLMHRENVDYSRSPAMAYLRPKEKNKGK